MFQTSASPVIEIITVKCYNMIRTYNYQFDDYIYGVNTGVKFLYLNYGLKRIFKCMIVAVFSPTLVVARKA